MEYTKFFSLNCNICGSLEKAILGTPIVSQFENKNIDIPDDISVVKCNNCGFYYTDPMPFWGINDIMRLYDNYYFPSYSEWWKNIREVVNPKRRLDLLETLYKNKISNFIEIGCGEGLSMRQALKRNWHVYGQDISAYFSSIVKKNLGIDIFIGDLCDAKYPGDYFNAVYLDSVIEHIPEPAHKMQEIRRILKHNGLVYIICPNEDALVNIISDGVNRIKHRNNTSRISPFQLPYHINGFTRKSLVTLAKNNSFSVEYLCIGKDYRSMDSRKYININRAICDNKLSKKFLSILYYFGDLFGMGTNLEAVFSAIK